MAIVVKAIKSGYYGGVYRNAGSKFRINDASEFSSKWMEDVNGGTKKPEPKPQSDEGKQPEPAKKPQPVQTKKPEPKPQSDE